MLDDQELLRRYAAQRAEEAFAELVRRHLDGVYSAALRRVGGDTHLAQDVAQQVFVALARKAGSVSRHPALSAWLYLTTRNEAANVVRRERRRKAREQEAHAMQDFLVPDTREASGVFEVGTGVPPVRPDARDAHPYPGWSRVAPVLDVVLDELNAADRLAILLRFVDRKAFAEIGAALRVSDDAARMRVDRALEKVRARLARRGITSTGAALAAVLSVHAVTAAPAGLGASVTGHALAAKATTGLGSSLIQFMSTTKSIGVIAGLGLMIAAVGTATKEFAARREAEAAVAAATTEIDAAVARRRATEKGLIAAQQDVARLQQEVDALRAPSAPRMTKRAAAPTAGNAGSPNAPAGWDPAVEGKAFLERHPEVKDAMIARSNAKLRFRWGPLYEQLKLPPAQVERFEALMRENESVTAPTADGKPLMLKSRTGLPQNEVQAQLADLLGPDGYVQFERYAMSVVGREFTVQLASSLYYTPTPITPEQSAALTEIMNANPSPRNAQTTGRFNWDAIMAKAPAVLSPPQLAALAGLRAQDQVQAAMNGMRTRDALPAAAPAQPRSGG